MRLLETSTLTAARVFGEEDSDRAPEDAVHEVVLYLGSRYFMFKNFFTQLEPDAPPAESHPMYGHLASKWGHNRFFFALAAAYADGPEMGYMSLCWDCTQMYIIRRDFVGAHPEVHNC